MDKYEISFRFLDDPLTEAEQQKLDINRANRSLFFQELLLSMLNPDNVIQETIHSNVDDSTLVKLTQTQTLQLLTQVETPDLERQITDIISSLPTFSQLPLDIDDHLTEILQIGVPLANQNTVSIKSSENSNNSVTCDIQEQHNVMEKIINVKENNLQLDPTQTLQVVSEVLTHDTKQQHNDCTSFLLTSSELPLERTDLVANIHQIGVLVANQNKESVISSQISNHSALYDIQNQHNTVKRTTNAKEDNSPSAQTQTLQVLIETEQPQADSAQSLITSSQIPLGMMDHITNIHQINNSLIDQNKVSSQILDHSAEYVNEEQQDNIQKTINAEESDSSVTTSAEIIQILEQVTTPFTEP